MSETGEKDKHLEPDLGVHTEGVGEIFDLLANSHRLTILTELLEQPSTQRELSKRLEINPATIGRQMSVLEEAGIIIRDRSHGPYQLTKPEATFRFLRAASSLSVAVAEEQFTQAKEQYDRLEDMSEEYDQ